MGDSELGVFDLRLRIYTMLKPYAQPYVAMPSTAFPHQKLSPLVVRLCPQNAHCITYRQEVGPLFHLRQVQSGRSTNHNVPSITGHHPSMSPMHAFSSCLLHASSSCL